MRPSCQLPFLLLLAGLLLAGPVAARSPTVDIPAQPEAATGLQPKPGWASQRFAVAAAHPLAVDAGYQILKAGGSAVDAAVAAQMVLTLVEPQSSGIGGGAFLLHHDGQITEAYDGRETAPSEADETLFLDAQGKPLSFQAAVHSGRSVGTPGVLRLLELAHRQHGHLPWARLFEPAIQLAEQGFAVSPRLHALLRETPQLKRDPVALAHYFDARGLPWPPGHVLKNPELAAVLRRIAAEGSSAFYTGEVAEAMVRKVREHPQSPGYLSLTDLAEYTVAVRAPCVLSTAHQCKPKAKPGRARVKCASAACRRPVQAPWPWASSSACWPTRLRPGCSRNAARKACGRGPCGCTFTPRPRAWPLPTAPSMWPIRITSRRQATAG